MEIKFTELRELLKSMSKKMKRLQEKADRYEKKQDDGIKIPEN